MEIEIVRYFVVESKSREIHDSPCIGASRDIPQGISRYGPFTKKEAGAMLELLKRIRQQEGWKETYDKSHLYQGDYDLSHHIVKENLPYTSLDQLTSGDTS